LRSTRARFGEGLARVLIHPLSVLGLLLLWRVVFTRGRSAVDRLDSCQETRVCQSGKKAPSQHIDEGCAQRRRHPPRLGVRRLVCWCGVIVPDAHRWALSGEWSTASHWVWRCREPGT